MNKHRYQQEILLECQKSPQTAEDIFKHLKKIYPLMGIGTVYRNLQELVDAGKLNKLGGIVDKSLYEIKSSDQKKIYGHLVCQHSNQVIKVDVSKLRDLDLGLPKDFRVEKIEVIFYGSYDKNCGSCRGKVTLDPKI